MKHVQLRRGTHKGAGPRPHKELIASHAAPGAVRPPVCRIVVVHVVRHQPALLEQGTHSSILLRRPGLEVLSLDERKTHSLEVGGEEHGLLRALNIQ